MLDVWRAADDIDLFESAWNFDHFYPIFSRLRRARASRGGRCSRRWPRPPAGSASASLVTGMLYRHPGGARQHGRHPRRHLRRPPRARHRRRLERGGVRRLRHRAAAAEASASTASTRRARCIVVAAQPTRRPTSTGSYYQLTDARCEPKPVQRPAPADLHRRQRREAHAARPSPAAPSTGTIPGGAAEEWQAQARRARTRTAPRSAATRPRSPPPPTSGSRRTATSARWWRRPPNGDAGLDLGIVYLPPPHRPEVLEPLAQGLRKLAG